MLPAAIVISFVIVLSLIINWLFDVIDAVDAAERRIDEERKPTQK